MKKLLAVLLILVFALSMTLVACNNDQPADNNDDQNNNGNNDNDNNDVRIMSHADYIAAPVDSAVVIEAYVQGAQGWWEKDGQGVITVFLQDNMGGYLAYEMACSEADSAKLTPGTKIKVTGYKGAWADEVEVMDATFEFVNDGRTYIAEPVDATAWLGTDDLIKHQNELAIFKGMTVVEISFKNGEPGDDIYVTLSKDGAEYSFCVERYLTGPETEVYAAVSALKAGDVVDVTGFIYWYNGVNTHITAVAAAK